MRKGTVRGSRLSMKHDQFYHDNDQLAFYKCSIVSTCISVLRQTYSGYTLLLFPTHYILQAT